MPGICNKHRLQTACILQSPQKELQTDSLTINLYLGRETNFTTLSPYKMYHTRYAIHPCDFKRQNTQEIRDNFLIQDLFIEDHVSISYTMHDRDIVGGALCEDCG